MARPDCAAVPLIAEIPFALIDTPLDYILANNVRQRGVCSVLRKMAGSGQIQREVADSVITYLERDMPLHHRD